MKFGTIIRLPDGRVGTVVYSGLDGYGIAWGEHQFTDDDEHRAVTGFRCVHLGQEPKVITAIPVAEAMLREPKLARHWPGMEVVGEEFEILG